MATCEQCKTSVHDGEERELNSRILCEDCYIDAILPKVGKMHYENDASEFMIRLKDSYSVHPQQYH